MDLFTPFFENPTYSMWGSNNLWSPYGGPGFMIPEVAQPVAPLQNFLGAAMARGYTFPQAPMLGLATPAMFGYRSAAPQGEQMGAVPEHLQRFFSEAAATHNVPQQLLEAMAWQESRFNPQARSRVGAGGVMQLMPATAQMLGVQDVHDPSQNIHGGARYMRQLLDQFGNDWALALAAYNAGPGRVRRAGGIPQVPETQNYVRQIMGRVGQ